MLNVSTGMRPSLSLLGLSMLLALGAGGCFFTKATVGLAKPPGRPSEFVGGQRRGDTLTFSYAGLVREDKYKALDEAESSSVTLSALAWEPVDGPAITQCRPAALQAARENGPVPLVDGQALRDANVVALHLRSATGSPPLSLQRSGDDLWIYCGGPGDVARAQLVDAGVPAKTNPGVIVAVVVLMPFALVADATVGVLLVIAKVK